MGSRDQVFLPDGTTTDYTYDDLNRLRLLTHTSADGTLLASYEYSELDATGRRKEAIESIRNGNGILSTREISWDYDDLYRLTLETIDSVSTEYKYDLAGNRIRKEIVGGSPEDAITYGYIDNDQLVTETPDVGAVTDYGYDDNGSLTSRDDGEETTYTYDLAQRLQSVTHGGVTTQFRYDEVGNRVSSRPDNAAATYYLVDRNNPTGYAQVLEESQFAGGAPTVSYVIGDDVLGQSRYSTPSWLLYDGHGSTRQLLDHHTGNILAQYHYDAYGVAESAPGVEVDLGDSPETTLLYAGEQYDPTLEQYYLRARYYNPSNGRFNRMDPFAGIHSDPQSLHKYAYAHCDPVNGVDPSGCFTLTEQMVQSYIQGSLRAMNFAMRVYRGYSKARDVLDIIQTGNTAMRFIKALDVFSPEAAISALYGEIRRSFGVDGLQMLGQGLKGSLRQLNEHWDDIRQAINDKLQAMGADAVTGLGQGNIARLVAANNSRDLKYVISLPSAPGNYDRSGKKTISVGRNLIVEVAVAGGSLFGLSFQIGHREKRIPVIRLDYWDVRARSRGKLSVHYHVPPRMKKVHNHIWTAPGVVFSE